MHRIAAFAAAFLVIVGLVAGAVVASSGATQAAPNRGRYVVVLKRDVGDPGAVARQLGRRHDGRVGFVYEDALKGFAVELPARAVQALERDPRVASVEADQVVHAFGEVPTGVDRSEVDKRLNLAGTGRTVNVDIAVLDTGIANHADLRVVGRVDCSGFAGVCKKGGSDGNGHGTHVAGTAAAKDNGDGVVGVAPGASLWAVKVLRNDGSGYMSSIVAGIDWVTARATDIEVANMSLGCECTSSALDTALTNSTNAGVVYVVAAGNSNKDAAAFSPAKHERVIAVSAVADFDGKAGGLGAATCRNDVDDTLANFSNFGNVVDVAAPGDCIKSTWNDAGYNTISGTSMASPHGAGAAALYVVENGVAKGPNRWSTVRDGLRGTGWSVGQSDPCGFNGENKSTDPFLMLAACD